MSIQCHLFLRRINVSSLSFQFYEIQYIFWNTHWITGDAVTMATVWEQCILGKILAPLDYFISWRFDYVIEQIGFFHFVIIIKMEIYFDCLSIFIIDDAFFHIVIKVGWRGRSHILLNEIRTHILMYSIAVKTKYSLSHNGKCLDLKGWWWSQSGLSSADLVTI